MTARGRVSQIRKGRASDGYGRVFFYASTEIAAVWHGGEYVDLFAAGTTATEALSDDDAVPFDCFNVWDHENDAPTIERTAHAFRSYMNERMSTCRVVASGFPGEVWLEDDDPLAS